MNAPTPHQTLSGAEVCAAFAQAIESAGLTPPPDVVADGKMHRFSTNGTAKDDAGWYILFTDGIPAGRFGCNRGGLDSTWCGVDRSTLTPEQKKAMAQQQARARVARDAEEKSRHNRAAGLAAQVWAAAQPLTDSQAHPYTARKGIQPHGVRVIDLGIVRKLVGPSLSPSLKGGPLLVIPMLKAGQLRSLQFIDTEGTKRPLTGGEKQGSRYLMGEPQMTAQGPLYVISEGWATAATIQEATGHAVLVAFDAHNLQAVGASIRRECAEAVLIYGGDDDHATEGNPGKERATAAAQVTGGTVLLPQFGTADRGAKATDWNDLATAQGLEVVSRQFNDHLEAIGAGFLVSVEVRDTATSAESITQQQSDAHSVESCPQICPQSEAATPENTLILTAGDLAAIAMADAGSVGELAAPVQAEGGTLAAQTHHQDGAEPDTRYRLPGMDERPCFQVLDEWTDTNGGKLAPGVWFFSMKDGKKDAPPEPTQTHVCTPIHIDALTQDAHTSNVGLLLRFKTDFGKWKQWAMPRAMLAGDCQDVRAYLLNEGARITHGADHLLSRYLKQPPPKRRIQCATQTGWAGVPNDPARAFVLPDAVIGPGAGGVVYQHEATGGGEYSSRGTLEGWRAEVAALAVGNPVLVLAICTSFAGPLLGRLNAQGGGLHFVGDSSTGKTSAVDAACSVWGGENFRRGWRATSNGMEGVAALFNDCLLALDEISECDPREVGAIVYMLGNGTGKQRAGRSGKARNVARWACSVLSSGEKTIETVMASGGHKINAGQSVRLLDVSAQRTHGAWDKLHHHKSGAALSGAMRTAVKRHHGTAGREFLERLTRDNGDMVETLLAMKALPELTPGTAEGQHVRAAERFAILALAGELATDYGVTGWPQGEAIRAAAVGLASWLKTRGDRPKGTTTERAQVLEAVQAFIQRHGDSRFSDADGIEARNTIRERAGWWKDDVTHGRRYWFHATGMKDALSGYDFRRAVGELVEAGAVEVPPQKEGSQARTQFSHRACGQRVRVYVVDPAKLDTDHTQEATAQGGNHGST